MQCLEIRYILAFCIVLMVLTTYAQASKREPVIKPSDNYLEMVKYQLQHIQPDQVRQLLESGKTTLSQGGEYQEQVFLWEAMKQVSSNKCREINPTTFQESDLHDIRQSGDYTNDFSSCENGILGMGVIFVHMIKIDKTLKISVVPQNQRYYRGPVIDYDTLQKLRGEHLIFKNQSALFPFSVDELQKICVTSLKCDVNTTGTPVEAQLYATDYKGRKWKLLQYEVGGGRIVKDSIKPYVIQLKEMTTSRERNIATVMFQKDNNVIYFTMEYRHIYKD